MALEEGITCALSESANLQGDFGNSFGQTYGLQNDAERHEGLEGALSAIEEMMAERLD